MKNTLYGRDILDICDLSSKELSYILHSASLLKKRRKSKALEGKNVALLFEKPSLRTRVSFEVAIQELGGNAIYLSPNEVGLGVREPVADVARVLSHYVDAIVVRTFAHATLMEFAHYASVPVINALSDAEHPCQALADILTIHEKKGDIPGLKIAFVGDGNNVAASLAEASVMAGAQFTIASPRKYQLPGKTTAKIRKLAHASKGSFTQAKSPKEAVQAADVVYTDVWTSMGQESESKSRVKAFAGYTVDTKLMGLAKAEAIFMHDLPAHRGEEVTNDVMEGSRSVVFEQAENRLHAQKALLLSVLSRKSL